MIKSRIKEVMTETGITLKRMVADTGLAEMTLIRALREQIAQCQLCTLEIMAKYLGCKTKNLYEEKD